MSLHNIWFERAWERWNARREKMEKYLALCAAIENYNVASLVSAAYAADEAILNVELEQHMTTRNAIDLKMKLTITITSSVFDLDRIIDKVRAAVDTVRPAGICIEYTTVIGTP